MKGKGTDFVQEHNRLSLCVSLSHSPSRIEVLSGGESEGDRHEHKAGRHNRVALSPDRKVIEFQAASQICCSVSAAAAAKRAEQSPLLSLLIERVCISRGQFIDAA